jgi:hypothetical protein
MSIYAHVIPLFQELSQIDRKYRLFLNSEIDAYALSVFRGYIERDVQRFCARWVWCMVCGVVLLVY